MALKEIDLHEPIKKWLEESGCEVKSEVRDIDMLGLYNEDTWIAVELKKELNLKVILQAISRQESMDLTYIAIPYDEKSESKSTYQKMIQLLKRLELGLLTVDFRMNPALVYKRLDPKPFDYRAAKRKADKEKRKIQEEFRKRSGDYNVAGSSRLPLITVYREQSLMILKLLEEKGPLAPKELINHGTDPQKTGNILRANHYHWFVKIKRGLYHISDEGQKALEKYIAIMDSIEKNIKKI